MANENNKSKELVSDDDLTAGPEAPGFRQVHSPREKERDRLRLALSESARRNRRLSDELATVSAARDRLEAELASMSLTARELEEKLEARSDAINALLTELTRKSGQVDWFGETDDGVSGLDDSTLERLAGPDPAPARRSRERPTRVLVGKIGRKLLRFPLFKDRLTIGRSDDNDIRLDASCVSRKHAVVQTDRNTTRLIDWGSKNGVYVNSARVTEHFLRNGDIVSIGNAHFRYDERPKRAVPRPTAGQGYRTRHTEAPDLE
ncbi:MAG: FHA domain-containing protein [Proteobacteria bacterium]|nr:FHA domain-containing protein [Pseudomonadota bacterium]